MIFNIKCIYAYLWYVHMQWYVMHWHAWGCEGCLYEYINCPECFEAMCFTPEYRGNTLQLIIILTLNFYYSIKSYVTYSNFCLIYRGLIKFDSYSGNVGVIVAKAKNVCEIVFGRSLPIFLIIYN
jgi:hypothetical protein